MFTLEYKQQRNPEAVKILQPSIKMGEKIVYSNVKNGELTVVSISNQNLLTIRQCSTNSFCEVSAYSEKNDFKIICAFIEGNDGFIIYQKPFEVCFLSKYQKNIIKLVLRQQLRLELCRIDVYYPTAVIYCRKQKSGENQILQLNFNTLQIKLLNDGKGYAPKSRRQEASLILDGRIYVFGGKDASNKDCDRVIWVYDIEKGYWFALEMDYPPDQNFSNYKFIPISTSRAMLVSKENAKIWILQVHQSRLTQLKNQIDFKEHTIILKDQLYFYQGAQWNSYKKRIVYRKK